jgi:hypothetical protein
MSSTSTKIRIAIEFEIHPDEIKAAYKDMHSDFGNDEINSDWIKQQTIEVFEEAERMHDIQIIKMKHENDKNGLWDGLGHLMLVDKLFLQRIIENLNVKIIDNTQTESNDGTE